MTQLQSIKLSTGFKMNPNIRVVILPIFSLVLLLLLIFPVFSYGYQKITTQKETQKEKQQQIVKLESKLAILREVQDSVLDSMDTSILAVPSVNPSLWKLYQIYQISTDESIQLRKRSAKQEAGQANALKTSQLEFGVSGDFDSVMNFLQDINKYVPLFTINGVNVKRDKGTFTAGFTITTYSAALPTQLPALTQPIKKLSDEDIVLLQKLAEMKPPEFTTIPPTDPSDRKSPFQ